MCCFPQWDITMIYVSINVPSGVIIIELINCACLNKCDTLLKQKKYFLFRTKICVTRIQHVKIYTIRSQ